MLKTLLKKQLTEIFRFYFYSPKTNKARSKGATAGFLLLYVLLMAGVLGGIFTGLSIMMCRSFAALGLSWMYFALLGLLAVLLGTFGSVFNTYSSLYLSKDNDLLLSLPLSASTIMASRLLGVYVLGLMYSAVVSVPAVIVYLVTIPVTAAAVLGGVLFVALITLIVMILSCVLGWVVAKITLKLRHKSFAAVAASLLFFGLYYFFCFRAQTILSSLMENALFYGEKIKSAAYPLYLFGNIGTGDLFAMAVYTAALVLLSVLTWQLLRRSFFKLATSSGKTVKTVYREKTVRQKTVFSALLRKEFSRFTSSSTYMLNCGMGALMLVLASGFLLLKGRSLLAPLSAVFSETPGALSVLLCALVCAVASMNYIAVPSVSLEGKSLYLVQSLPVDPWQALRAKLWVQLLLTILPALFCLLCGMLLWKESALLLALSVLTVLMYCVFSALFGLFLGLKMVNLTWTNEVAPIKQSGGVLLALLCGWIYALALGGLYFLCGSGLGAAFYLALCLAATALLSLPLYLWLRKKGAKRFASL